jgi:hypothetical protein
MQAKRLRRIGDSRATVRANLSARESASDAKRYGAMIVRMGR